MFDKGFLTVEMVGKDGALGYQDGKPKLQVVSKGEVVVGMKDGVEYVLRLARHRGSEDDENATGDSRYIYAYARVNPNLLDQPQLEPLLPLLKIQKQKKKVFWNIPRKGLCKRPSRRKGHRVCTLSHHQAPA